LHVAKLFAKHLKVDEQAAILEGDVRIGVGTPNRVLKLFDVGAVSSSNLHHVIIDMGLVCKSWMEQTSVIGLVID
jgi:superfamily II DNA/RNA helicase